MQSQVYKVMIKLLKYLSCRVANLEWKEGMNAPHDEVTQQADTT
jgi:hypothetical protein